MTTPTPSATQPTGTRGMTLFVAGDVMLGRGIDQILPHAVPPGLHESHVESAQTYVRLAEAASGPIPSPVAVRYVWGEALPELSRTQPDARLVNLETAVTTSEDWWPQKGIHYRMHPGNVAVLTEAGVDVCVLGNNHVMDWGRKGLRETLRVLRTAGLHTAGAGLDREEAAAPAVLTTPAGRLLVFSYGTPGAGLPPAWTATDDRPGVNLLPDLSTHTAQRVAEDVQAWRRDGDRVVVSIHWGGNWGYGVPRRQQAFAHRLVDARAADLVHGHSSHHPKGVEVYGGRAILYGCGDFVNDYEGISGHDTFRGDLTLMYFPELDVTGRLVALPMTPMRIRRFRLQQTTTPETRWLADTMDRESRRFGTRIRQTADGRLAAEWT